MIRKAIVKVVAPVALALMWHAIRVLEPNPDSLLRLKYAVWPTRFAAWLMRLPTIDKPPVEDILSPEDYRLYRSRLEYGSREDAVAILKGEYKGLK
jgi:hypothetical protein